MGLEIKAFDLIFQIVNFTILFLILKKFLFGPFLSKIAKEQKDAEEAKKRMADIDTRVTQMEEEERKAKEKSAQEAKKILESAKDSAEKIREELKKKAQAESEEIIKEAKVEIENQKTKIKEEIKKDLSSILETSLTKLNLNLVEKEKKQTVEDAIKSLSNDKK